ncbi:pancreatic lipase-like protein [Euroglyphus maynei]|uniref:Pancreatic lipase-like protein n=1 Tax=Euroglyphus maynei TaxID=6958 RepID=A0A1Y3BMI1_EURMA|nr:pancreatic lipase-like protein [Euroglyphus maynei]
MGNYWSNKPENDDQPLEQPRWFGRLPDPDSIESIRPTLTFYDGNGMNFEIDHEQRFDNAIDMIRTSGCFNHSMHGELQQRLIILTHGFRSDKYTEWLHECKNTILDIDHHQWQVVAILGWGGGADLGVIKYQQAAANCFEVGKWLGNFMEQFRLEFPNVAIYCIGHSLGAHLMGMAGRINGGNFDRITGLDPAGPGFQDENHDKRLNNNDAIMVDVIHTDGQDVPYFGTLVPLGKIDFYPNYGWNQPSTNEQTDAKPMMARNPVNNRKMVKSTSQYGYNMSESHSRAIEFFIWSIQNPGKFRTYYQLEQVPDVEKGVHRIRTLQSNIEVEMGYHMDAFIQHHIQQHSQCLVDKKFDNDEDKKLWKNDRKYWGNYYVHTNAQSPWC